MRLGAVAHSRSGDKGPVVNISVIALDLAHYPRLARELTAARVKAHFADVVDGEVTRYELPQLGAMNFVFSRVAGDSVTRTLALDAHGKSLSSALLEMEIPD